MGARTACFAILLGVLLAGVVARPAEPRVQTAASRAPCSTQVAERAARRSGFATRVERYWGRRFGSAEFSVWDAVCGDLAGRHGRDMVVVMLLDSGTGGSPKPWAIFNRTRRGRLRLHHVDLGKHLICPQSVRIHNRVLTIYRPSEYLGAYTLCDRMARYRWNRRGYVLIGIHNAFTRCRTPRVVAPPGGGFGLIVEQLRVASLSCGSGLRIARRDIVGEPPGKWHCAEILGGEQRCSFGHNWRKWLTYRFGGDAG